MALRRAQSMRRARRHRGVAWRDVVITAVVVVGLAALLPPYIHHARVKQRRETCEQRQLDVARAMLTYESIHGKFPGYKNLQAVDSSGNPQPTGWVFPVLPYLELPPEQAESPGSAAGRAAPPLGPWSDLHATYGPSGPDETRGRKPDVHIADLVCPSSQLGLASTQAAMSSFVVNTGMPDAAPSEQAAADWPANGVFLDATISIGPSLPDMSLKYLNDHDGAGMTWMLSENVDAGLWTDIEEGWTGFVWVPAPLEDGIERLLGINQRRGDGDGSIRFARPSSGHPGGVNMVYCDRSSRFVADNIDYRVFVYQMTPDDSQVMYPGTNRLVEPPYRLVPSRGLADRITRSP